MPAAADPVRRRGAGARPDGVFSGAPWHRPARPPGVIAPHNGTVERQRKAMSVSVNAVDDPSHEHAVPIIPEVVNFLDCAAMRHRQAQGSGQVPEQALRRSRMAARLSITAGGSSSGRVARRVGTPGLRVPARRPSDAARVDGRVPPGAPASAAGQCRRPDQHPNAPKKIVVRWEPAAVRRGVRGPPRDIRARKTEYGP